MNKNLSDVIGKRGENIVELCFTDYSNFATSLFSLTHLGEKWPAVDYYVELTTVPGRRLFFFVQAKATASPSVGTHLRISSTKDDVARLLEIPAPTYIVGVHEPTKRAFIRSVHDGVKLKAMTRIPVAYELTSRNLEVLHSEVVRFWKRRRQKPTNSVFL